MDTRHVVLAANVAVWQPGWRQAADPGREPSIRVRWDAPHPALEVRCGDGRWILLHSRRQPAAEAERWLAAAAPGEPPTVVAVVGAGLGYVVDVIERQWPQTRIILFEADPAIAEALLSRRDWVPLLRAGRLHLLVGPDYVGITTAWRLLDGDAAPRLLTHPVTEREFAERKALARDLLARIVFDASANLEARRTLGGLYLEHTLRNLPTVLQSPSVDDLAGHGCGRAAIICAAGPSLDDNLASVAQWRHRGVLITADTALRPLLAHGAEPDYVVTLDPTSMNTRHLAGVGTLSHAWLVAEPCVEPSALEAFASRLCFFRVSDNEPWPFLLRTGMRTGTLPVWGSVLTAAFSLARRLDCDPIVFVGADLAYTHDRPYARGTIFESDWARGVLEGTALTRFWRRMIWRRKLVSQRGVDGREVMTAPHLLSFRDWLEAQSREARVRVVNATGAGLLEASSIEQQSTAFLASLSDSGAFDPAPARVASTPARVHQRLAAALETVREDKDTRRIWQEAAPALDREQVQHIIEEVAARLAPAAAAPAARNAVVPPDTQTAVRGLRRLPELVAVLNARRHGRPPDEWARRALTDVLPTAAGTVDGVLSELLQSRRAAIPLPPRTALTTRQDVLPELRVALDPWPAEMRSRALALAADAARAACDPHWNPPTRLVLPPSRGSGSEIAPEMSASPSTRARALARAYRTAMLSLWLTARHDPARVRLLQVLDTSWSASWDSPLGTGCDAALRITMRARQGSWCVARPVPMNAVFPILAGGLFAGDGLPQAGALQVGTPDLEVRASLMAGRSRDHHRAAFLRDALAWLTPRWLTDAGLPRCHMGASLDARHALLTPRHSPHSLVVDAAGNASVAQPWPAAIVGEHRAFGRQVAWTQQTPCELFARRDEYTDVARATIDAVPITAHWLDAQTVAVSTDRGLWRWTPGRAPEQIAALPPTAIVFADEWRVQLDPVPLVAGVLSTQRLDIGWDVDAHDGRATARPLTPWAQAWGRAVTAGVEAWAHPEADAVRLAMPSRTLVLAWPRPRGVAWLGHSLLVWGTSGDVGVLPDVVPSLLALPTSESHV